MSDEMRECPFCGAAGTVEYMPSRNSVYPYFPACSRCAVGFGGCETEKKAVKVWNKRADVGSDALRAERDVALAKVAYLESALSDAEAETHMALSAFNELAGKWAGVPWDDIAEAVDGQGPAQVRVSEWFIAHAPQPQGEEKV